MKYFFNKWHDFAGAIKNKRLLLLFDFDGTLTPIIPDPDKVRLSGLARKYLKKLSKKKHVDIGIISGRSLEYITRAVGVKGVYYAGNHGLEVKGPKGVFFYPSSKKYSPYLKEIADALRKRLAGIKGAGVEYKKLSLSLHYRRVFDRDIVRLRSIFGKVVKPYVKKSRVRITSGKKVLEVRPPVLCDKGDAVKEIEKMTGRKGAVKIFIGDDLTDEDAFRVLGKKDFSIRVGRKRSSKARYYLKNPNEVRGLLVKISRIVTSVLVIFSLTAAAGLSRVYAQEVAEEKTPAKPPIIGKLIDIVSDKSGDCNITTYSTKTKDGWTISIKRYVKKGMDPKNARAAVILCHGFNINNNFWDLDRRCSPARYLARNGYDVWAPSLRGSGRSSKTTASKLRSIVKFELKELPHMLLRTPFDITKFGWTLDSHIHEDVPAIVDFVRKKSGFEKVYWIGHSMGGIVMFGYLETEGQEKIAGFIPVGSMMVVPQPLTPHLEKIANQKQLLKASLLVNTTLASQVSNFTLGAVKSPIEELLLKRENMYDEVVFRFFRTCIDDTSPGVVGQYSDSIRKGEMLSYDGRYSYTDNMRRVTVPTLFISGGSDGFVSEEIMKKCYDAVSSKDKQIIIFSKANGYSMDYGHSDVIVGKNSGKDVYPEILTWLDKRAPVRQP